MGKTSIEWTDYSWNPIRARISNPSADPWNRYPKPTPAGWHCEHVSEGCRFCYAETFNRRLGTGLDFKPGHRKNIEIFLDEKMLLAPLKWKAPRKIFVCSMTDLAADFVSDDMLDRIFAIAALCPQHTFIILTKRPKRMRGYVNQMIAGERSIARSARELPWQNERIAHEKGDLVLSRIERLPLPNVWLGTSCEDQDSANERIPHLLETPAAVRFLSCEPLLGLVDLTAIALDAATQSATGYTTFNALTAVGKYGRGGRLLHWVIVGGESGPRPMHPDWARSLRDQCASADVSFFFKQWGDWQCTYDRDREDPDWRNCPQPREGRTNTERYLNIVGGWGFHGERVVFVKRVGKKRAGRLLDGVEHNAFPGSV